MVYNYGGKDHHTIVENVDKETTTPTDFTIEVSNLPENATDKEIKDICLRLYPDHIYNVYTVRKFDYRLGL